MKIKTEIQFGAFKEKGYSIYTDLSKKLKDKKLEKLWIISGVVKDEGFTALEKEFNVAKDNGADINFLIGVDRKTVSEQVLSKINNISNKTYIYNNNQDDSFNSKIYVFEYDKKAEVVLPSTNLTLNGITKDISNVIILTYSLPKEQEEYNDFMFSIKDYIYPDANIFILLDDRKIKELSIKRELLILKSSDFKHPSISDYLKHTQKTELNEKEAEEKIKDKIKNIVKDFDVLLEDDTFEIATEEIEKKTKKETKKTEKKATIKTTKEKEVTKKTNKKEVKAVDLDKMLKKDIKKK